MSALEQAAAALGEPWYVSKSGKTVTCRGDYCYLCIKPYKGGWQAGVLPHFPGYVVPVPVPPPIWGPAFDTPREAAVAARCAEYQWPPLIEFRAALRADSDHWERRLQEQWLEGQMRGEELICEDAAPPPPAFSVVVP